MDLEGRHHDLRRRGNKSRRHKSWRRPSGSKNPIYFFKTLNVKFVYKKGQNAKSPRQRTRGQPHTPLAQCSRSPKWSPAGEAAAAAAPPPTLTSPDPSGGGPEEQVDVERARPLPAPAPVHRSGIPFRIGTNRLAAEPVAPWSCDGDYWLVRLFQRNFFWNLTDLKC